MRTHAAIRALIVLLGFLVAGHAFAIAPALAAPVRVKVVTVYSDDPNDPSATRVGAIKVKIGPVTVTTGDGTDELKCLGGANFRLGCFEAADCPGGVCGNPGDNDGNGTDEEGNGLARTEIPSGTHAVSIPTADLLDELGNKYRVGSIRIEETVTAIGQLCKPNAKPEGNVGFQFNDDVDHSSASDYTVAIRIVPLAAPTFTGGEQCSGGPGEISSKVVTKCKRAVADAAVDYDEARAEALDKCRQRKFAGKLAAAVPCLTETDTLAALQKASAKLVTAIGKACGGKDKTCGGDATGEVSTGLMGFPDRCPGIRNFPPGAPSNDACRMAITSCADVAACLQCIGARAVDQFVAAHETLVPTLADPKTQKQLNKCQRAISKVSTAALVSRAKQLNKCWGKRLAGKTTADCLFEVEFADSPRDVMCKACGGAFDTNAQCVGADVFALHQVAGQAALQCPSLPFLDFETIPSCQENVTTLGGLIRCADCAARFASQCPDQARVPSLTAYPDRCRN